MAVHTLQYTVEDEKGDKSTVAINLPDDLTLAQVVEFSDEFAPILDAVTGCVIRSVSLSSGIALPAGLAGAATDGSRVEAGARFIFETENGYTTAVRIPGIPESMIVDGSRLVDQANASVIAFINAMEAGIAVTGGTAEPSDYREDDIVDTLSAVESFQRSRR